MANRRNQFKAAVRDYLTRKNRSKPRFSRDEDVRVSEDASEDGLGQTTIPGSLHGHLSPSGVLTVSGSGIGSAGGYSLADHYISRSQYEPHIPVGLAGGNRIDYGFYRRILEDETRQMMARLTNFENPRALRLEGPTLQTEVLNQTARRFAAHVYSKQAWRTPSNPLFMKNTNWSAGSGWDDAKTDVYKQRHFTVILRMQQQQFSNTYLNNSSGSSGTTYYIPYTSDSTAPLVNYGSSAA